MAELKVMKFVIENWFIGDLIDLMANKIAILKVNNLLPPLFRNLSRIQGSKTRYGYLPPLQHQINRLLKHARVCIHHMKDSMNVIASTRSS